MTRHALEALYPNARCVIIRIIWEVKVSSFLGFHFAVHSLHKDTVEFWSHHEKVWTTFALVDTPISTLEGCGGR